METLDMTFKEVKAELFLRSKGKKGEWKIATDTLVKLWMAKRANLPMGIARKIKD